MQNLLKTPYFFLLAIVIPISRTIKLNYLSYYLPIPQLYFFLCVPAITQWRCVNRTPQYAKSATTISPLQIVSFSLSKTHINGIWWRNVYGSLSSLFSFSYFLLYIFRLSFLINHLGFNHGQHSSSHFGLWHQRGFFLKISRCKLICC